MLWNTLLLALRAIRRNLLRSFLTTLGIVIGVAAVITMVTLGNGATKSVSDQISGMGSNMLIVVPGQRFGPGSEGAPSFKSADVEAVRSQITGVEWVAPVVNKSLTIDGQPVDFKDAETYYRISTVNYLAAGSCNFNDGGVSLWPLEQIENDTQHYVRDAMIHRVQAQGKIAPTIEGRLLFATHQLVLPIVGKN